MKNRRLGRPRPSSLLAAALVSGSIAAWCITACDTSVVVVSVNSNPSQGSGIPAQGNVVRSQSYAYVASANSQDPTAPGAIYQYSINADGSLSPLHVPSVPTGVDPRSIIADPTGHFVYTANSGDGTISEFAVGADGGLTPLLPASILLPGASPTANDFSLSIDPAGPYVYVVVSGPNGSQPQAVVDQFSIGPNGTLTPLIPASVSVPGLASGALAIDLTGAYAYLGAAVDNAGAVFQFAIGAQGALTPLPSASVSTPASVVGIDFAPNGNTAYVLSDCVGSSCDGSVAPYAIANTGVLSPVGAATLTGSHVNPVDLFVDGSGSPAYLLANFMGVDTNSGSIYLYTISGAGELTPSKPSSILLTGAAVAQSAFGPDLYVLTGPSSVIGGGVSHVATYSIGNQGELTSVSSTQISASEPTGMALVEVH